MGMGNVTSLEGVIYLLKGRLLNAMNLDEA